MGIKYVFRDRRVTFESRCLPAQCTLLLQRYLWSLSGEEKKRRRKHHQFIKFIIGLFVPTESHFFCSGLCVCVCVCSVCVCGGTTDIACAMDWLKLLTQRAHRSHTHTVSTQAFVVT